MSARREAATVEGADRDARARRATRVRKRAAALLGIALAAAVLSAGAGLVFSAWERAAEAQAQAPQGEPQRLQSVPLTIFRADGSEAVIEAEVADTPQEREIGLMFRRRLGPDQGMLFIYETTREAGFWMRNTLIPLDMIFIREDGIVHRIHENAVPLDETPIPSLGPVRYVLEVAGGQAAALGVAVGDQVSSLAMTPMWVPK